MAKRAFTLVELLVVITIIGILVALLLPAVQSAREAARRSQCMNNVRQIALALHNYHSVRNVLPYGCNFPVATGGTWAAFILPQLEQQTVFDRFNFNLRLWDPANQQAVETVISVFICPSDPKGSEPLLGGRVQAGQYNTSHSMGLWYPTSMGPTRDGTNPSVACVYCPGNWADDRYCCSLTADYGCCGNNGQRGVGVMDRTSTGVRFEDIRDGLANTLLLGETLPAQCTFNGAYNHNFPIAGTAIPLNTFEESREGVNDRWYTACGFKSRHPGGANFAMADGSIHFLSDNIDYRLYNLLGHRSDGNPASVP